MYSIVFPKTIEAITRIRNKRKSCKVYNENVKEKMNKKNDDKKNNKIKK